MKQNDWKDRLNVVFSTNKDYAYQNEIDDETQSEIPPEKQQIRIELDKRRGKTATLLSGFQNDDQTVKELAKILKNSCGTGGSSRDQEILIQGDFRKKIADILKTMGYKIKGNF